MNEIKIINFIKYTLKHYSGDVNDLEWSTEQIQALLSMIKKRDKIIEDFIDPNECSYDHHGNCQEHGWTGTNPPCPHKRAKVLLKELESEK